MKENEFRTVRGYQLLDLHKNCLTPSLEDYLEMICRIMRERGQVKVGVLAKDLNVMPSSASKMIGKLALMGFINYEKYGIIKLTETGEEAGAYLLWRHDTIRRFFRLVSGDCADTALMEAELTEHVLSRETVEGLALLVDFFGSHRDMEEEYLSMKNLDLRNSKID